MKSIFDAKHKPSATEAMWAAAREALSSKLRRQPAMSR